MVNKKLVNLIIIALVVAFIIIAIIIKNNLVNSSESNIEINDENVNEIQNTNETEDTSEIITKETIQALQDVKNGKNISKAFSDVDEMFKKLDK